MTTSKTVRSVASPVHPSRIFQSPGRYAHLLPIPLSGPVAVARMNCSYAVVFRACDAQVLRLRLRLRLLMPMR